MRCKVCSHLDFDAREGDRCPRDGSILMAIGAREKHPHDVLLGELLDDEFALVDILGVGGFGTVYKAIQFPVRRPVAVKVLHSHYYRHEGVRQRFFQEARAIGSLTDSSIVKLIRFGEIEPGQPLPGCGGYFFMAQEFISGLTLRDATRQQGRFSAERAVGIALQILRALADAHRRGVVHRDLKPGNIMLTRDALGEESARVLDFGVAKMLETIDDPDEHTPDTLTGVMLGTPNYMAPEQIHGDEIKPATDLYAVGILLYEMISGRRPFHRTTRAETLRAQLTESAPKLTRADGVDDALAEVINKALHKDAGQRFHDAVSFIRALQNKSEPTSGPQPVVEVPEAPLNRPSLHPVEQTIAASAPVSLLQAQTTDDSPVDAAAVPVEPRRNSVVMVSVITLFAALAGWFILRPKTATHPSSATSTTKKASKTLESKPSQPVPSTVEIPAENPAAQTAHSPKPASPSADAVQKDKAIPLTDKKPDPHKNTETIAAPKADKQTKPDHSSPQKVAPQKATRRFEARKTVKRRRQQKRVRAKPSQNLGSQPRRANVKSPRVTGPSMTNQVKAREKRTNPTHAPKPAGQTKRKTQVIPEL
ncbi:MAG: protein kinase [Myxococcota bacterium]|nr:protein kinase [Myxococcota bacterium]